MRTPISYYGGKQLLATKILPLIPEHTIYTEAFFGGGAIFWAKEPSQTEIINDANREVVNFYECLQNHFERLRNLVQSSLHSRGIYYDAMVIYNHPHLFHKIRRAWAFWILTNQGFGSKIGSWGFDTGKGKFPRRINNKKLAFTRDLVKRLELVQIECTDALKVIEGRDRLGTFHYIDPPYINSNQGHYDGYTPDDFRKLLELLNRIEGKFLMSSYPSDMLAEHVTRNDWHSKSVNMALSMNKGGRKTEVLTANYPIEV